MGAPTEHRRRRGSPLVALTLPPGVGPQLSAHRPDSDAQGPSLDTERRIAAERADWVDGVDAAGAVEAEEEVEEEAEAEEEEAEEASSFACTP